MADEIWAMAERRATRRPVTLAYWFGEVAPFYLNWVACSAIGAAAGSLLGDPKAIGADFAFTALFIGLIAGFWRGRSTAVVVVAAACVAALAYVAVGSPWHVLAGATFATRIAGFLLPDKLNLGPRARAALDAIPAAVLVSVIAPSMLATGWRETAASLIAALAATRAPLIGVVAIGVAAVVLLRQM
jgi:predicted branched-subunit amino acid permease